MLNSVNLIATLKKVDEKNPKIRYCEITRPYQLLRKNEKDIDVIPLVNWNKDKIGELFTYKNHSIVSIGGRIETLDDRLVVVTEKIEYLGLKG